MRSITWLGTSLDEIRKYSSEIRSEVGYNLERIQRGLAPADWKPISSIGMGVKELRIHTDNECRVVYVTKFAETVYILHAFIKKSQKTLKRDIDLAKMRYKELLNMRRML